MIIFSGWQLVTLAGRRGSFLNALALISVSHAFGQTIVPYSGTPQTSSGGYQQLVALVRDADSQPVAGVSVRFTAPGSGATVSFIGTLTCALNLCTSWSVLTDSNGFATSPGPSPAGGAGKFIVTATGYASAPANFFLENESSLKPQRIGIFQSNGGPIFALKGNSSNSWDGPSGGDLFFNLIGPPGSIAVTGDWNGNGKTKVGVYSNGTWMLDYNGNGVWDGVAGGDKLYTFVGNGSGYVPLVGDWNGDGKTKIGIWNNGFWCLDLNGDGAFTSNEFFAFGGNGTGEVPILGDWNGDKRTKIGWFYKGVFVLDYDGDGMFQAGDKYYNGFVTYVSGDKPVVGDWTGDGKTKIGVYRSGFWALDRDGNGVWNFSGNYDNGDRFYAFGGNADEIPLVGDWLGVGAAAIGVYFNGFFALDANGNGSFETTPPFFFRNADQFIPLYLGPGTQPLIGKW